MPQPGGQYWPTGSLNSRLEDFGQAGRETIDRVFTPEFLTAYAARRNSPPIGTYGIT